jgi:rieske iron-sulfur protein
MCAHQTRRSLLATALGAGACLATGRSAGAEEGQPGSDERPQAGDLLVVSEGPQSGQVIKPSDLKPGGPPLHAWPKDSKTSVVRDGSRLNEILVIKLDPAELDDDTRARAADGIVAYSAICTRLAALPLAISGDSLSVAAPFAGKVGAQQSG